MIIFIQYPLVDTRPFRATDTGRLMAPLWPAPIPYREFVRNFGQIQHRSRGGIRGWVAESELCRGKNAIRFTNGLQFDYRSYRKRQSRLTLRCGGRHFYFDGQAVAKLEIVLIVHRQQISDFRGPLSELLDQVLDLDVALPKLPGHPRDNGIQLRNAGKHLAQLYLISTTRRDRIQQADPAWIKHGDPMVVLESDSGEGIEIPQRHTSIELTESGMDLEYWRLPGSSEIGAWFMRKRWQSQNGRALRMLLMRLHAEQQALQHVLKSISAGEICPDPASGPGLAANRLQFYLNVAARRIFRLSGSAEQLVEPEQVAQVVRSSFEIVSPGQRDALLQMLELQNIRPQVKDRLESAIERYCNVYELGRLSQELTLLRKELQKYEIPECRQEIEVILEAEQSARAGDEQRTLEVLKSVGKWVLVFAEKVGVELASTAMKSAFGM